MQVKEIPYKEESISLHDKIWQKGKVAQCQIELTFRCSHRCNYCYIPPPLLEGKEKGKELNTEAWKKLIDKIVSSGVQWISFTGGDPFTREDFLEIYLHAKKKGTFINILTNAGNINKETAKFLKLYRPFTIEVTLNSIKEDTFEKITRVKGSLKKAMEGIFLLKEFSLPFKIKFKVLTLNLKEMEAVAKFSRELKVPFNFNFLVYPRLDGSTEPLKYRLTPETIKEEFFQKDEYPPPSLHLPEGDKRKIFKCGAGTWSFSISPEGKVMVCPFLREYSFSPKGNLLKEFKDLSHTLREKNFTKNTPCSRCSLFYFCSWCPAIAFLETGDYQKNIPYYCKLTRILGKQKVECEA
ncbi:MAG: radical SAM protein [Caldiserica bacterium]|nr:radical SAM protein [Caldisericota bacterium]